jgi:hypothetical protein
MVTGSGLCAKVVVVDARHHMLGRLASILSKELLNGQRVVRLLVFFSIAFVLVCLFLFLLLLLLLLLPLRQFILSFLPFTMWLLFCALEKVFVPLFVCVWT